MTSLSLGAGFFYVSISSSLFSCGGWTELDIPGSSMQIDSIRSTLGQRAFCVVVHLNAVVTTGG